jgi:hypothetical protein
MYPPPAAIVQRGEQAPQRIMLVFDCSRSMKKGARLNDAKSAIMDFLKKLPAENVSAGLIMFGHRYGWVQQGDNLVQPINPNVTDVSQQRFRVEVKRDGRTQELKAIALNDQLTGHNPNFDVEVVANLAPLSPNHRKILIEEVDNADALGVTPTYQAIVEAYSALGGQGGYIVVMTDGKPFLAGASLKETGLKSFQENARRSAAQEFKQNKNGVQLRIINFANNDRQTDLRTTFPGSFQQADNAGNLLEQLNAGIKRPKVSWRSAGKVVSQEGDLEKPVVIDQWPPTPNAIPGQLVSRQKYTVTATVDTTRPAVSGTDVWVEGGEQFELELQDKRLVHVPYPRSRDVLKDLETSGGGDLFNVSALPLIVSENLQLIIENKNPTEFTPRPSDIWIDLIGSDEQGRPLARYSISLAEFVPESRVPILVCRVKNWPERAKTVSIDAWFRFGDPVAERIELPLDRDQTTIDEFPGVKFAVKRINGDGGYRIEVTERHDQDSDLHSLRILPEPMPKRAATSYYEGSGITRRVIRVFEFDRRPDSLKLYVTRRDQIAGGNSVHATRTLRTSDR